MDVSLQDRVLRGRGTFFVQVRGQLERSLQHGDIRIRERLACVRLGRHGQRIGQFKLDRQVIRLLIGQPLQDPNRLLLGGGGRLLVGIGPGYRQNAAMAAGQRQQVVCVLRGVPKETIEELNRLLKFGLDFRRSGAGSVLAGTTRAAAILLIEKLRGPGQDQGFEGQGLFVSQVPRVRP